MVLLDLGDGTLGDTGLSGPGGNGAALCFFERGNFIGIAGDNDGDLLFSSPGISDEHTDIVSGVLGRAAGICLPGSVAAAS